FARAAISVAAALPVPIPERDAISFRFCRRTRIEVVKAFPRARDGRRRLFGLALTESCNRRGVAGLRDGAACVGCRLSAAGKSPSACPIAVGPKFAPRPLVFLRVGWRQSSQSHQKREKSVSQL